VHLFSKVKALLPDDFRKLKVFAERSDEAYSKVMRQIGFQPVPLEFTDILQALTAGNMIEALMCAPFYALAGQFYNAAKHMVAINWAPLTGGAVISRKAWDTLPAATQAELLKIAAQTGEEIQAASRKENEEAVAAMEKRGLAVHRLDAEAQRVWDAFAETLQQHLRGTLVPADAFDEAVRLAKAYRAQNPAAR
jgi:TRAP-type C4-dicarboxylate transport system substrate-binding protein